MPPDPHPASSTHPPLPPTTEDERVSWLRLLRSRRVGPATFRRLLAEHGTAAAALDALPGIAQAAGEAEYTPCPKGVALAEMRAANAHGATMLTMLDAAYPPLLRMIDDAPPILWAVGDPGLAARSCIGLVGARNASSLGLRMARGLATDLGRAGHVIASGLARGIDAAAHAAAIETGTIAVMAGGVDVLYPPENSALAEKMRAGRALFLSEQPMGTRPQARHFPRRNRIISGLSRALVVVEAAAKSGSLITARTALDQGREVLAVPGHPFDARASGCNMLIRDGARLVRHAEDVIEVLPEGDTLPLDTRAGLPPGPPRTVQPAAHAPAKSPAPRPDPERPATSDRRSLRETAALHGQILNRLGPSPLAEDQLIRDLGQPAHAVSPVLLDLELDGRIRRQAGGFLSLA